MGSVRGYWISGGNSHGRAYRRRKTTEIIPKAARIARQIDLEARTSPFCSIMDLFVQE
jgi:hypothetical protein